MLVDTTKGKRVYYARGKAKNPRIRRCSVCHIDKKSRWTAYLEDGREKVACASCAKHLPKSRFKRPLRGNPAISMSEDDRATNRHILGMIQAGDRVTILIPNGIGRHGVEWKEKTGRAVMRGPHGWVLNMGGPHGTPGVATEENLVRVKR